jgi:predicted Zn-dependent peptidase
MIQRQILDNGLTVITETMPHVRSVAVGIWVKRGSRHERPEQGGISHFIEHMVFKGTRRRSAEQIAAEVDSIGGHMDAFTAKEYAAFHLKVLDQHLPLAVDILGDIVRHPLFAEQDIAREKKVVFEEMSMVEDTPDDLVMELFNDVLWPDHPLGRPILGTRRVVRGFTRAELLSFFRRTYHPGNVVVAAAGRLEHAALVDMAATHLGSLANGTRARAVTPPVPRTRSIVRDKRELEQVHLCLGTPAYSQVHADRHGAYVLNTVLGGSMSSRLFQNVREKRGLAYSISSGLAGYSDAGNLTVYAGTSRERLDEVLRLTVAELRRLKHEPVPADELRRAKDHLKGSVMLSLESTGSRMSHLARQEIYFGGLMDLDATLEAIERVHADDVQRIANELFQGQPALSVLGRLNGYRPDRSALRL